MDFGVKRALEVAVIFACAIGVGSTAIIMTNNNNDRTKSKNDGLWSLVDKNGNNNENSNTVGSIVSTTESQVGKYADIDGDGTVDGIIFADLLFDDSGTWDDDGCGQYYFKGMYKISKIDNPKEYKISQINYNNKLGGTADVITPSSNEGNDRFYIMALDNVKNGNSDLYSGYYNTAINPDSVEISDYRDVGKYTFGTGKSNTELFLNRVENYAYKNNSGGWLSSDNIWLNDELKSKVNDGWFIPSNAEWGAFAKNINITPNNYKDKGLPFAAWSSTISGPLSGGGGIITQFHEGHFGNVFLYGSSRVRLAHTF